MPSYDEVYPLLRHSSDQLIELIGGVDPKSPSYASDWSIAQVCSHLGSGAELTLNTLQTALGEAEPVEAESVWGRWNAYSPEQMVSEFVESDRRLLDHLDAIDPARRDGLTVQFFIGPTDVPTLMSFRLHEHALHSWDVRVALDPQAEVDADAAPLLLENVTARLVGFVAKPDPDRQAGLSITGELPLFLAIGEGKAELRAASDSDEPSGTLAISPAPLLRLLTGRLDPEHTPADVHSEGRPTLDELRTTFPGF